MYWRTQVLTMWDWFRTFKDGCEWIVCWQGLLDFIPLSSNACLTMGIFQKFWFVHCLSLSECIWTSFLHQDNTNPIGPCLVSTNAIKDPQNIPLTCTINSQVLQDGITAYAHSFMYDTHQIHQYWPNFKRPNIYRPTNRLHSLPRNNAGARLNHPNGHTKGCRFRQEAPGLFKTWRRHESLGWSWHWDTCELCYRGGGWSEAVERQMPLHFAYWHKLIDTRVVIQCQYLYPSKCNQFDVHILVNSMRTPFPAYTGKYISMIRNS